MTKLGKVPFIFGFLIPLVSWSGRAELLLLLGACSAIWLHCSRNRVSQGTRSFTFLLPIVALTLCWGLVWSSYQLFVLGVDLTEIFFSRHSPYQTGVREISFASLLFIAAFHFGYWTAEPRLREETSKGLLVGGGLALLISIIQSFAFFEGASLESLFPNQNAVWNQLGRPVGTFRDPNAYGIFSAIYGFFLVRALLQTERKEIKFLFFVSLILPLTGGLFSGSRTFVIFFGLCCVLSLLSALMYSRRTYFSKMLVGASFLVIVLTGLYLCLPFFSEAFPALNRVQETVAGIFAGDFELISDRVHFSLLSLYVFSENPFVGIGPLRFANVMTSYADFYHIPLGLWIDNANNSYFGFLAEFGILGVVLIVLMLRSIRLRTQNDIDLSLYHFQRGIQFSFLLILLFGPHYLFPEVLLPIVLMFSLTYRLEEDAPKWRIGLLLVLVTSPLILLRASSAEHGLYHWEKGEQGNFMRWSGPEFQTLAICKEADQAELVVRNGQPQDVTLSLNGRKRDLRLRSGEVKTIKIPCPTYIPFQGIVVRGSVRPTWVPNRVSSGEVFDPRTLGVQILHDSPSDLIFARKLNSGSNKEFLPRVDILSRSQ